MPQPVIGGPVLGGISLAHLGSMAMLRLGQRRRAALSETVRELANLFVAGLVIGQLITDRPFSWSLGMAGIALWTALVAVSLRLEGD